MLATGIISASWQGCPLVFYAYGTLGVIWSLTFGILGSNRPVAHPRISEAERTFIETSLGHVRGKVSHRVPLMAIFRSGPVWALLVAQSGYIYCSWTLLSQIPSYINHVMQFNIKNLRLGQSHQSARGESRDGQEDFQLHRQVCLKDDTTLFGSMHVLLGLLTSRLALIAHTKADQVAQAVALLMLAVGSHAACMSV
ncbi:hypothetical protein HUJ04_011454 [Dendroctonus ponderosae]|nr:hypothetical protein HUJ04_011454 [Dendroctonus ponderosae]